MFPCTVWFWHKLSIFVCVHTMYTSRVVCLHAKYGPIKPCADLVCTCQISLSFARNTVTSNFCEFSSTASNFFLWKSQLGNQIFLLTHTAITTLYVCYTNHNVSVNASTHHIFVPPRTPLNYIDFFCRVNIFSAPQILSMNIGLTVLWGICCCLSYSLCCRLSTAPYKRLACCGGAVVSAFP